MSSSSWTARVFASAHTYPSRPVRIISPYSTGIAPDIAVRAVAERRGPDSLHRARRGAAGEDRGLLGIVALMVAHEKRGGEDVARAGGIHLGPREARHKDLSLPG